MHLKVKCIIDFKAFQFSIVACSATLAIRARCGKVPRHAHTQSNCTLRHAVRPYFYVLSVRKSPHTQEPEEDSTLDVHLCLCPVIRVRRTHSYEIAALGQSCFQSILYACQFRLRISCFHLRPIRAFHRRMSTAFWTWSRQAVRSSLFLPFRACAHSSIGTCRWKKVKGYCRNSLFARHLTTSPSWEELATLIIV